MTLSTKQNQPKRRNGKRCPDCAKVDTQKDGRRKAKGSTNGVQLWRCLNPDCKRHQFIEGETKRYKGRVGANEAWSRSAFELIHQDVTKTRSAVFHHLVERFKVEGRSKGVTYRTIARWYEAWLVECKQERVGFERSMGNAPQRTIDRVFMAALSRVLQESGPRVRNAYSKVMKATLQLQNGHKLFNMVRYLHDLRVKLVETEWGVALLKRTKKVVKDTYAYTKSNPVPYARELLNEMLVKALHPTKPLVSATSYQSFSARYGFTWLEYLFLAALGREQSVPPLSALPLQSFGDYLSSLLPVLRVGIYTSLLDGPLFKGCL